MAHHFKTHYSRDEARALLPQLRAWLEDLARVRNQLLKTDLRINTLTTPGGDFGGDLVNTWVRHIADLRHALAQFESRDIQVKDIDRGLVDFPAIIGGKEVFLCWEKDEDDIEFWHDLETGYGGREKLS
jgi:hypothetical protein